MPHDASCGAARPAARHTPRPDRAVDDDAAVAPVLVCGYKGLRGSPPRSSEVAASALVPAGGNKA
eukprot:scaffold849_cov386-Prasinococcus_capsulatus_cf.AAC.16